MKTDLVKKLETENEFQQKLIEKLNHQIELLKQIDYAKATPGSRLNQRLIGNSAVHVKH